MTTLRTRSRTDVALRAACALALLTSGASCGFGDMGALVPDYTCTSSSDCSTGSCVANVCAVPQASGYSLVLRLEGSSVALVSGPSGFTFPSTDTIVTGERDLAFPVSRAVEGTIRYGDDFVVETQIAFRRTTLVAGLVDEVRATSPTPSGTGEDGRPIDFRATMVPSSVDYEARFVPTSSPTSGAVVIPGEFVGKPLSDVFPPMIVPLPTDASSETVRLDVRYGSGLFLPCVAGATSSCTVSGRVLSPNKNVNEPEVGVSVVLEDERGIAVSTTAVTADDGTFALRIGSPGRAYALHIGPSGARSSYPDLTLDAADFDPRVGGDVVIPRFDMVRFEGRVERRDLLVSDAVVRAVAVTVLDVDGVEVPNARFETTVRSTGAAATDGAGLFALSLVRGHYDVIASEASSASGLVHSSVLVNPIDSTGTVRGVTVVLGPTAHFDGVAAGPDGRALPYLTVQALPQRPIPSTGSPQAYARVASITGDVNGRFDLSVDRGTFDVVFSLPASEGLPAFVLPDVAIGAIEITDATIVFPPPVAIFGTITDADGSPRPGARVSAYFYRAATDSRREEIVPLAQATADDRGHYRILVPSSSGF